MIERTRGLALAVMTCFAMGSLSCATLAAPSHARPPASGSGDQLFASGDYAEAVDAYGHELGKTSKADERARVRLFRALALLAEGAGLGEHDAMQELRTVDLHHAQSLWGRIARIHVLELTRRETLRDALMQAGADLREAEQQLELLQHRMLAAHTLAEDQESAIGSLEGERKKLQRQLDAATEQMQAQSEQIIELQRELEALKQIDMRRKP
jgi:chromosome segregation ATPase